jgi:hypothetical protein
MGGDGGGAGGLTHNRRGLAAYHSLRQSSGADTQPIAANNRETLRPMTHTTRRTVLGAGLGLAAGGLAAPHVANAQAAWPTRPITLVVGFPPGGQTDFAARVLQPGLSAALGQPVAIDNPRRRRRQHRHGPGAARPAGWLHAARRQCLPHGDQPAHHGAAELRPAAAHTGRHDAANPR